MKKKLKIEINPLTNGLTGKSKDDSLAVAYLNFKDFCGEYLGDSNSLNKMIESHTGHSFKMVISIKEKAKKIKSKGSNPKPTKVSAEEITDHPTKKANEIEKRLRRRELNDQRRKELVESSKEIYDPIRRERNQSKADLQKLLSELRISVTDKNTLSSNELKEINLNKVLDDLGMTDKELEPILGVKERVIYTMRNIEKENKKPNWYTASKRHYLTILIKYHEIIMELRKREIQELEDEGKY